MSKEFVMQGAPSGKVRVLFFITGVCDLLHAISIILGSNLNYFVYHSITVALYVVELLCVWNARKLFYTKKLKVVLALLYIYCVCWIVVNVALMVLETLGY